MSGLSDALLAERGHLDGFGNHRITKHSYTCFVNEELCMQYSNSRQRNFDLCYEEYICQIFELALACVGNVSVIVSLFINPHGMSMLLEFAAIVN